MQIRLKEIYRQWTLKSLNFKSSADVWTSIDNSKQTFHTIESLIKSERSIEARNNTSDIDKSTIIKIFPSFADYRDDLEQRASLRKIRNNFENSFLATDDQPFTYPGYCCVCCDQSIFEVTYLYAYQCDDNGKLIPNWRESLVCKKCGMNNRIRAIADLLMNKVNFGSNELIYATEELTIFYQWLKQKFTNVIGSEFLGDDKVPGKTYNNLRHEDITRLSFSDSSVDAILSFEVLEHVPDTDASIREFLRVLREGGFALISVPFVSNNYETIVRATVSPDGTINHILEPEYHGNPTNPDEGSLCFYHFGWDLVDKFKLAGASDAAVISYYSIDKANLGPEQLFFLILK